MKYSEVERKLREAGCWRIKAGANHDWWFSPITGLRFQVPRHKSKEANVKTLKNISGPAGVKF